MCMHRHECTGAQGQWLSHLLMTMLSRETVVSRTGFSLESWIVSYMLRVVTIQCIIQTVHVVVLQCISQAAETSK